MAWKLKAPTVICFSVINGTVAMYMEDWRLRVRDGEGRGGGSQGTRGIRGLLGLVGEVKVLVDTMKRER